MDENIDEKTKKVKHPLVLKWILVLGIMIVVNLFISYAVKAVQSEPEYEDFCQKGQIIDVPENQKDCVAIGGQWSNIKDVTRREMIPVEVIDGEIIRDGYCNPDFTCWGELETAKEKYNRNVFIVFVIAGLVLLLVGVFLASYASVSLGLSLGGVLAFIIGSIRYWSDMDEYVRVIILGVALIVLIWLGIKKFKD